MFLPTVKTAFCPGRIPEPLHSFLLLHIHCFLLCVHLKLALSTSKDTRWVKCEFTMGRMQFCQQRPCLVSFSWPTSQICTSSTIWGMTTSRAWNYCERPGQALMSIFSYPEANLINFLWSHLKCTNSCEYIQTHLLTWSHQRIIHWRKDLLLRHQNDGHNGHYNLS